MYVRAKLNVLLIYATVQDIKEIRLTENKLYALSTAGKLYALSPASSQEVQSSGSASASDSWWGTSWFGGKDESIKSMEIVPKEKLSWGEQ